ncbi:MAG: hypothetical protein AAF628_01295 [Planctomycetota bacterium]
MKPIAIMTLALATMGVPCFLWVSGSVFGVSSSDPIGKADKLEAWLAEKGYRAEARGAEATVYQLPGEEWCVTLTRAADGALRKVEGFFWTGREEMGAPRGSTNSLMGTLWLEVAGARPVFVDGFKGKGRLSARMVRTASFEGPGAVATWEKLYKINTDTRSIFDTVTLERR